MNHRDYHRQKTIEDAVQAADRIILDKSDGSVEETNYLTSQVALRMLEKVCFPINGQLLKKDMGI